MHQDLLQLQTCQCKPAKPFQWAKQNPRSWYTEIILTNASRHVDWKWPIPRKHLWAITLSVDRNDINNLGPKSQPSKTILTLKRDASTWKAIYGMHRCPDQTNRENKNKKTKEKLIVVSCTWKFELSLNENQESQKNVEKMMKNCKNTNHSFFCKGLLLSLGNCVWNEKWPSFTIPSLM